MINSKCNSVLVIGDIMLDDYIEGDVTRISPEAPIPIIKINKERYVLGGAANVANNVAALGCKVGIIGNVGNDDGAKKIFYLLNNSNIEPSTINCSNEYKTIIKKRVIGNQQQIARLDYNDDIRPTKNDILNMIQTFNEIVDKFDVVVISDYNKGVCTKELCSNIIRICIEKNKVVIVDPKGNEWDKYKGATIITPNLKEISEYLNKNIRNNNSDIEEKCKCICNMIGVQYVLLTRSEQGMTLIDKNNNFVHLPSQAKEVFDVSGAGDTVVAALSCFINKTDNILEEISIANIAAGIVVSKKGTAVVTLEEINEVIMNKKSLKIRKKIMNITELMEKVLRWKNNKESIVFTNGCFDIFHKGHVHLIYSAAELGDHLIVAINSDASVKRIKGDNRPINNELDRAYVIAAIGCVDAVVIFDDDTPEKILNMIRPNILVKGGDYKIEEVIGREFADKVVLINYIDGYSTTGIINKMNKNDVRKDVIND
jgi:D-beta-D-heptose 7-phosphate kinase/D-beta-D-heptose 1-phosphate adenosyltransferase